MEIDNITLEAEANDTPELVVDLEQASKSRIPDENWKRGTPRKSLLVQPSKSTLHRLKSSTDGTNEEDTKTPQVSASAASDEVGGSSTLDEASAGKKAPIKSGVEFEIFAKRNIHTASTSHPITDGANRKELTIPAVADSLMRTTSSKIAYQKEVDAAKQKSITSSTIASNKLELTEPNVPQNLMKPTVSRIAYKKELESVKQKPEPPPVGKRELTEPDVPESLMKSTVSALAHKKELEAARQKPPPPPEPTIIVASSRKLELTEPDVPESLMKPTISKIAYKMELESAKHKHDKSTSIPNGKRELTEPDVPESLLKPTSSLVAYQKELASTKQKPPSPSSSSSSAAIKEPVISDSLLRPTQARLSDMKHMEVAAKIRERAASPCVSVVSRATEVAVSDSLLRTTQARLADKKEIEAAKLRESHGVTFVVPPESYKVPESLMRTTQSIIAAKNEWEQAKHRIIPERDIWWEQREGKQLKVIKTYDHVTSRLLNPTRASISGSVGQAASPSPSASTGSGGGSRSATPGARTGTPRAGSRSHARPGSASRSGSGSGVVSGAEPNPAGAGAGAGAWAKGASEGRQRASSAGVIRGRNPMMLSRSVSGFGSGASSKAADMKPPFTPPRIIHHTSLLRQHPWMTNAEDNTSTPGGELSSRANPAVPVTPVTSSAPSVPYDPRGRASPTRLGRPNPSQMGRTSSARGLCVATGFTEETKKQAESTSSARNRSRGSSSSSSSSSGSSPNNSSSTPTKIPSPGGISNNSGNGSAKSPNGTGSRIPIKAQRTPGGGSGRSGEESKVAGREAAGSPSAPQASSDSTLSLDDVAPAQQQQGQQEEQQQEEEQHRGTDETSESEDPVSDAAEGTGSSGGVDLEDSVVGAAADTDGAIDSATEPSLGAQSRESNMAAVALGDDMAAEEIDSADSTNSATAAGAVEEEVEEGTQQNELTAITATVAVGAIKGVTGTSRRESGYWQGDSLIDDCGHDIPEDAALGDADERLSLATSGAASDVLNADETEAGDSLTVYSQHERGEEEDEDWGIREISDDDGHCDSKSAPVSSSALPLSTPAAVAALAAVTNSAEQSNLVDENADNASGDLCNSLPPPSPPPPAINTSISVSEVKPKMDVGALAPSEHVADELPPSMPIQQIQAAEVDAGALAPTEDVVEELAPSVPTQQVTQVLPPTAPIEQAAEVDAGVLAPIEQVTEELPPPVLTQQAAEGLPQFADMLVGVGVQVQKSTHEEPANEANEEPANEASEEPATHLVASHHLPHEAQEASPMLASISADSAGSGNSSATALASVSSSQRQEELDYHYQEMPIDSPSSQRSPKSSPVGTSSGSGGSDSTCSSSSSKASKRAAAATGAGGATADGPRKDGRGSPASPSDPRLASMVHLAARRSPLLHPAPTLVTDVVKGAKN